MVAVLSTMQALGSPAKKFRLPDVTDANTLVSLADYENQSVLIMFICNHCPYVVHVAAKMTELANEAHEKGVGVVAISSNDVHKYPQDGPDKMAEFARHYGFKFPYLFDDTQQVAKDYFAACTPDLYVYNNNHRLAYRGQMDDSRPGNGKPVTGEDLQVALIRVLNGQLPDEDQTPSMGCNIKWRAGNEPDYF